MSTISDTGLDLIKRFEGLRLEAYLDPVGIPTIGYGTIQYPGGKERVRIGDRITQAKAELFLRHDCERFENVINTNVFVPLTQNQFDALVSFTYNVGAEAFLDSTMLKLINKGYLDDASKQFARWVQGEVGGKMQVLPGLVSRREAERKLFVS